MQHTRTHIKGSFIRLKPEVREAMYMKQIKHKNSIVRTPTSGRQISHLQLNKNVNVRRGRLIPGNFVNFYVSSVICFMIKQISACILHFESGSMAYFRHHAMLNFQLSIPHNRRGYHIQLKPILTVGYSVILPNKI